MRSDSPHGRKPRYTFEKGGYWYWWPPKKVRDQFGYGLVPLGPDRARATAFRQAEALNREVDARRKNPTAAIPGSVRWLFETFFETDKFRKRAPATQRQYRWVAKVISAYEVEDVGPFGDCSARAIRPRHADALYEKFASQRSPHVAHMVCRVARRVWKWAKRKDFVDENPWAAMELEGLPAREQVWEIEQVRAFVAKANELGRSSLGLATLLAYWFGWRQGDILGLTWTQLREEEKRTNKTGARVPVDPTVYPDVQAALEAAPKTSVFVVVREVDGRPYNEHSFRHDWRAVADAAGIPRDLQFRDLRATAQTELIDAGVDPIRASTHLGHKTLQMQRRYTRRRKAQFTQAALLRLELHRRDSAEATPRPLPGRDPDDD